MSQARPCGEARCVRAVVARTGVAAAGGAMSMLEQRSYVVGTCHGMSPEAVLTGGIASADMPWHVPTAMGAFISQWHCLTELRSLWVARTGCRRW